MSANIAEIVYIEFFAEFGEAFCILYEVVSTLAEHFLLCSSVCSYSNYVYVFGALLLP